jgi:methyl-accepting chemotaxis protein
MTASAPRFNLRLGTKLRILIGAALASMIVISAVAAIGMNRVAEDGRRLYEEGFNELSFIGEFRVHLEQLNALVSKALLEAGQGGTEESKRQYLAIASELRGELLDAAGKAEETGSHHTSELEAMVDALTDFVQHSILVYRTADGGDWYGADKILKGEAAAARERLIGLADRYIAEVNSEGTHFIGEMKDNVRVMGIGAAVVSVTLVLLVGGMGFHLIGNGMGALNAMTGVTGRLAGGDMDVQIPGGDRADEIGEMARSLEQIRAVGLKAARAQSSLDDASSPMMIVDLDGTVLFPNKAMVSLAERLGGNLSTELAGFAGAALNGVPFDQLHNVEAMGTASLAEIAEQVSARMAVAGHTFDMTASPVFNDDGARLGSLIEWKDMSGQVAVEREIAGIVHAASEGDFSQRLAEADKSGFMAELANGMNELLDVVDHGLDQVVRVMAALAKGDLTVRMQGQHKGAFGSLKQDADRMGERMDEMLGRIANVSSVVKTATDEISSGISDLSARTEHQASSLEETTASMEELSATVRQNADNAQEANQVAAAAREAAVVGGDVTRNAVVAMGGIEESSKKITEIVGLIQEIAFQTNLLALNASVEAARAGEAGRGFAVVANEVRALAQRAASASKDIKDLITDSDNRVKDGARLVNEAGSALEEIVNSVKKVADFVSDIAAASQQQTSGLDQVSSAVSGMDEMTQQNAALVEETTGAIQSAMSQVDELQSAVGFFKTANGSVEAAEPETEDDADAAKRLRDVARSMGAGNGTGKPDARAAVGGVASTNDDGWDEF